MFDSFAEIKEEAKEVLKKHPKVKIFEFNISLVGEVVAS